MWAYVDSRSPWQGMHKGVHHPQAGLRLWTSITIINNKEEEGNPTNIITLDLQLDLDTWQVRLSSHKYNYYLSNQPQELCKSDKPSISIYY